MIATNGEKYTKIMMSRFCLLQAINNVDADAMFALFDDEFQAEISI